ncbi:hypothetical protein AVEN_127700-1, partial [Araneus ventricosus]
SSSVSLDLACTVIFEAVFAASNFMLYASADVRSFRFISLAESCVSSSLIVSTKNWAANSPEHPEGTRRRPGLSPMSRRLACHGKNFTTS